MPAAHAWFLIHSASWADDAGFGLGGLSSFRGVRERAALEAWGLGCRFALKRLSQIRNRVVVVLLERLLLLGAEKRVSFVRAWAREA